MDAALFFSIGFHCGFYKCLIDKNLQRGSWMPSQRAGTERFQKLRQKLSRKASFAGVADRSACRAALGAMVVYFLHCQ